MILRAMMLRCPLLIRYADDVADAAIDAGASRCYDTAMMRTQCVDAMFYDASD